MRTIDPSEDCQVLLLTTLNYDALHLSLLNVWKRKLPRRTMAVTHRYTVVPLSLKTFGNAT
jgi:hypothetical protein